MVKTQAWKIYIDKLKYEFDREHKVLRKCNRDTKFYKTQGLLNAFERAMTIVDDEIKEYRATHK